MANAYVLPLEQLRMTDVASVGGKNSSLGELISQLSAAGVRVPGGFATTSRAFTDFLGAGGLKARIDGVLAKLDVEDVAHDNKIDSGDTLKAGQLLKLSVRKDALEKGSDSAPKEPLTTSKDGSKDEEPKPIRKSDRRAKAERDGSHEKAEAHDKSERRAKVEHEDEGEKKRPASHADKGDKSDKKKAHAKKR